jgi:hypothetical protein
VLEAHVSAEDLLGYKLDFRRAVNSTDEVRMGHLTDQTMVALCEPARAMIASIVASTAGR